MKTRAKFQVECDRAGRIVGYRKQVLHPITGERLDLRGKTVEEVMGRADDVLRLKRDNAAGLVSHDEMMERLSKSKSSLHALMLTAIWARYLSRLDSAWKMTGGVGRSDWAQKVEGLGRLHVLPENRLGRFSVFDLTFDVLVEWQAKVLKLVGEKSFQNIFYCLTSAVKDLIRARKLSRLPWGDFKARVSKQSRLVGKGRAKLRDSDEFARMFAAARKEDAATRATKRLPDLAARFGLMTMLGLRRGEAAALAWDCVRVLPTGDVLVETLYQAREGWRRQLPKGADVALARPVAPPKCDSAGGVTFGKNTLTARLLLEQKGLLESRGLWRAQGPVFPDERGAFRARDVVPSEVMRRLAVSARIVTPGKFVQHSTRHSNATLLLSSGASVREAMAITRHKNIETFQGYISDAGRSNVRLPDSMGEHVAPLALAPYETEDFAGMFAEVETSSPVKLVARGGVIVDDSHMLETTPFDAEENRRRSHAKYLGHKVGDFSGQAFQEWLQMGQPMRRPTVKLDRQAMPPTVLASAAAAAKRAQEKARRVPGVTAAELTSAHKIGFSRACNGWQSIRRIGVAREINEGRGNLLTAEVLADVLTWSKGQLEKAGLSALPAELVRRLPKQTG